MVADPGNSTLGVVIAVVVVGLVLIVLMRLSRRSKKVMPALPPKTPTPPWIWVFLIALTVLIAYVSSGRKPQGQPPAEPLIPGWAIILVVLGLFVGLILIVYAVMFFRFYDRDASKAIKLANAGDKDGALTLLKAAMAGRKPSANRSNALGILYVAREEWTEAYQAFLDAESIGGRNAAYLSNQGLALWKMGRPIEAEPILREAHAMAPADPTIACNLGNVLTDLGQIEDALRHLAMAETAYEKLVVIPPGSKKPVGEEIAKLRVKLGSKKAPRRVEVAGPFRKP